MRNRLSAFVAILAVALAAGHGAIGSAKASSTPTRVLFIGNSYTLFNDMPATLAAMAASMGHDIRPEVRAFGGASFAAHRRSKETLAIIASGTWDVVVLQDHSLSPSRRPGELLKDGVPHARFLADAVRKSNPNARLVYFATWGRQRGEPKQCLARREMCSFGGHSAALSRGYRMYRRATGGEIAPVGDAWRQVVQEYGNTKSRPSLWLKDGSHPSTLGSYLVAAVILRTIVKEPVAGANYDGGLYPPHAKYLRRNADSQY